jgi:hypothetical protein
MEPASAPGILLPVNRRRIDGRGDAMNALTTIGTIRTNLADLGMATVKTLILLAMLAVLLAGIDRVAALS